MTTADEFVEPKPGIPKTLGILNIIFAVLLILVGGCGLAFFAAMPSLAQVAEKATKDQQAAIDRANEGKLKALDEREKAETGDAQKAAIAAERESIRTQPKVQQVDFKLIAGLYKKPVMMGYNLAYAGSGLLLHLVLLVSGVLLVRRAPAGRAAANAWAILIVAQMVAFTAAYALYVQPAIRPEVDAMVEDIEAKVKANNAPPQLVQQLQMIKGLQASSSQTIMAAIFVLAGAIYPAILLILINTRGARAALAAPKAAWPGIEP